MDHFYFLFAFPIIEKGFLMVGSVVGWGIRLPLGLDGWVMY